MKFLIGLVVCVIGSVIGAYYIYSSQKDLGKTIEVKDGVVEYDINSLGPRGRTKAFLSVVNLFIGMVLFILGTSFSFLIAVYLMMPTYPDIFSASFISTILPIYTKVGAGVTVFLTWIFLFTVLFFDKGELNTANWLNSGGK